MSGAPGKGSGSEAGIRVCIRLFATYAEAAGRDAIEVTLPPGAVAADALAVVRAQPWAGRLAPSPAVAVNRRYAKADAELRDGDEVAIIPPVAGG
ncbi:MAG TPA: MoaD/ThiS family protein [Gemmatimonadales bacterium]|nr:MoaD/ThiS family protein [Gemmatimonadales bacterium]